MRLLRSLPNWLTILISFLMLLAGWHLLVMIGEYPSFILPSPVNVAQQMAVVVADGRLLRHSLITISEIIPGLLIGFLSPCRWAICWQNRRWPNA